MVKSWDTWDFRRRDLLRQASAMCDVPYQIGLIRRDLTPIHERLQALTLAAFDPALINLAGQNIRTALDLLGEAEANERARLATQAAEIAAAMAAADAIAKAEAADPELVS